MRLTMVGTGYVGLVTGTCFSNTGNHVICLDVDPSKIDTLNSGGCPIYEPGLTDLIERNVDAGRLTFTTDKAKAYKDADMIFICVGTPSDESGHADLKYVFGAADDIADVIKSLGKTQKPKTVVVKSTVPVGTTLAVKKRIIERIGRDYPFNVANNPEFLKEGAAINDFNKPDRVVVGVEEDWVAELFRDVYDPFVRNGHPIFIMDILSSEMVKYASNNFLATKISFINEIAELCERTGADVHAVARGMGLDGRIGRKFLHPGPGYGGSCFPKDTRALIRMAEDAGTACSIVQTVVQVNDAQRLRMVDKVVEALDGDVRGKTVGMLGLSFKPETDDLREAPALDIARELLTRGAVVRAFDPVAMPGAARLLPDVQFCKHAYGACEGADAMVLVTEWNQFRMLDLERLRSVLRQPVVVDLRNVYEPGTMRAAGFRYTCVGR